MFSLLILLHFGNGGSNSIIIEGFPTELACETVENKLKAQTQTIDLTTVCFTKQDERQRDNKCKRQNTQL